MCTQFCNGSFVVHKTKKCFSSVALDRGHEQVNAGYKGEGGAVELTENPAALKPLAKLSQRANAAYRRIVGRSMLRAFGHPFATCCDVLGVVGTNLTIFKLEPTTPNMSQHITTRWPNARIMLHPTMLRYVALACCDRLPGALEDGWFQVLN